MSRNVIINNNPNQDILLVHEGNEKMSNKLVWNRFSMRTVFHVFSEDMSIKSNALYVETDMKKKSPNKFLKCVTLAKE